MSKRKSSVCSLPILKQAGLLCPCSCRTLVQSLPELYAEQQQMRLELQKLKEDRQRAMFQHPSWHEEDPGANFIEFETREDLLMKVREGGRSTL